MPVLRTSDWNAVLFLCGGLRRRAGVYTACLYCFTPVGGSVCHKSVGLAYHRQGREPLQNGISQQGCKPLLMKTPDTYEPLQGVA